MSDLKFSVIGESASATKFIGKTRQFTLVVDEPEALGGTDDDANPVEYILAGFAGCINVVGQLVAKELGFKINNLKIEVSGELNPNRFLGSSNNERAGFKFIEINLIPETNASIETLTKWLQIVEERCPVRDNLYNKTPVKIAVEKEYNVSQN
ncbi:OsmC family protein [Lacinutrix sp. MedPE-SW]|mgnify:CR=1 FL=1|uniref:OsmC family protein n=1 Tax=Lacinutrix sp. MedPE-SW TaxID=1860087 RepID=UPI0009143D9F|nr:OsmC family protein [Lacinutrix sp. MedPE-SW]OIQ23128.1 MAG: osmotically inducible protein C [Lacinutrix sp. MedPE-SW]